MRRWFLLLPVTLIASTALAAPMAYGGALDPVTGALAVGLGGFALWRAKRAAV